MQSTQAPIPDNPGPPLPLGEHKNYNTAIMSKTNRQHGFSALTIVIAMAGVIVVALVAVSIYRNSKAASLKKATTVGADWKTFQSAKSSITFKYPPTWKLTNINAGERPNYFREGVDLAGPNGFTLHYSYERNHVNAALSCIKSYRHTPVVLSGQYQMIPEGAADNTTYNVVLLETASNKLPATGCPLELYTNWVDDTTGFTFYGGYGPVPGKPTADFLKRPEVVTAKSIFSTFVH